MIIQNTKEELAARLFVNKLLEEMKPFEVRDYIDSLTPEQLIEQTRYKGDEYEFYRCCFGNACRAVFEVTNEIL